MAVDRISVTVPSEIGEAVRALAEARGQSLSTLVTDAVAHQLRLAALDDALSAADAAFGPVPQALVDRAEQQLLRKRRPTTRSGKRTDAA